MAAAEGAESNNPARSRLSAAAEAWAISYLSWGLCK